MIYIQKDTTNTIDVTVSNETTLTGATYLFELVNLERKSKVRFIPENVTGADVDRFDSFTFSTNDLDPIVLTGNTCNIHLHIGPYSYNIYDQTSPTNLDPTQSNGIVETGLIWVTNQ
jgi:hypothetical protein